MFNQQGDAATEAVAAVARTLEAVRVRLEDRFLEAGATLAAALERVETLIQALDRLTGALEGDASADAHRALQDAAADLLALPAVQAERRGAFEALVERGGRLGAAIEDMRTMLRYLRAFGLNLKVTAAAAPEFAGFAEELMERIAIGADKLALFAGRLGELDGQLRRALAIVNGLEADGEQVLPAVVGELQASAEAIQQHNREIGQVAGQVAELARRIRARVGAALVAMQIGDNTRQRIEHVQAGLALLAAPELAATALGEADAALARTALLRLLADQLGDLTEAFGLEARKVGDNLVGLGADAREVLRLKGLIGGGGAGSFLRDLEGKVGRAHLVVDQVRDANIQAGRAGRAAVDAVEALLANVDAIQSVKTEIRYMAINTSLRCSRMGEAGRPVNVIGMELRAGADRLGETADRAGGDIDGLAEGARRFIDHDTEVDIGRELAQALRSIREAGDGAEADLAAVSAGSAEVGQAVEQLSAHADFHGDLDQALRDALAALRAETGEGAAAGGPPPAAQAAFDRLFGFYTMDREREVHRRHAPAGGPAPAAEAAEDEDQDQALFAGALF